jgi:hypothetical protein
METLLMPTLVVLCAFTVGLCLGLILGGMSRDAKAHDEAFAEHERDAPYPRVGD